MFSKQEQFTNETLKKLYGFADPDYALYDTYGRNAKPDLISIVTLSKQVFGKDNTDFSAILNLIEKYCNCDSANPQAFQAEEKLLTEIVEMQGKYITASEKHFETLNNKTRYIFSDINDQDKNDIDVRKNDLKYIITQTQTKNMLDTAACLKMYFDGLMYGLLPAGPLPESEKSSHEGFTAKESPLFTHEPVCTDIPQDKAGPFFAGLRTLAETDALFIKGMFRDCNNGKVYVRLYDPDNSFAPEYIEVEKADAYYQWIIKDGGDCRWPGYIISALQTRKLSIDSDPEDLFSCILGSKIEETDLPDFCTFDESKIVIPENTREFKIKSAYKNCGIALYASLLTTNSNLIEDPKQYLTLLDAMQEFVSCFSLSAANKQTRDAAANLLKQHSDSFRNQASPGGARMKKRILICDAIDTLLEVYSTGSNENPLEIIRAKYPQLKV